MYARCPAGQVTYRIRKARHHRDRRIQLFVFDNQVCSAYPTRDKCVRGNKPRTATIGYYEKKRTLTK